MSLVSRNYCEGETSSGSETFDDEDEYNGMIESIVNHNRTKDCKCKVITIKIDFEDKTIKFFHMLGCIDRK